MAVIFIEKNCQQCGKKIKVRPCFAIRGRGKYCSTTCKYEARSEIMSGKKPTNKIKKV